jgi:hypothetical protein
MRRSSLTTVFALAAVSTLGTPAAAVSIVASAVYGGHTYFLLSQANWSDSEAFATSLGGHLATIGDASENAFIYETFTANGSVNRGLWIGLNDAASEGVFVWSSGEPVGYTNWGSALGGPPEPNNGGSGGVDEDYAHILFPGDPRAGTWNDAPDVDAPFGGIPILGVAEIDSVPEPHGTLLFGFGSLVLAVRKRLGIELGLLLPWVARSRARRRRTRSP